MEENVVSVAGLECNVTISLGAACRSPEVATIDALLKVADEAVYEAKRLGRNRVVHGDSKAA